MMNAEDIIKQAQAMQVQMQQAHDELASMQVAGQAGGGLIKVVMTGRHDIKHLFLDPNVIQDAANSPEGKKVLQELLAAAINDAVQRIEEATRQKMAAMAQNLQMPAELMGSLTGQGDGESA